jgi:hypothetical protein
MRAGVLRLLLLALLSVGVVGMHTIGHSTDHHSIATAAAGGAAMMDGPGPSAAMAGTCHGDCGAHGPLTVWPGLRPDPVPGGAASMIVCLAVLFGVGLVALLSRALGRRAGPVPRGAPPATTGPLRAGSTFPLRLVDVAVLRT